MYREMYQHRKTFWEWSRQEWLDTLCPTTSQLAARTCAHKPAMDMAYLLGGVTDLRSVGMEHYPLGTAYIYFGAELVDQQCERVISTLKSKGFTGGKTCLNDLTRGLSLLLLLNRCPYLEDLSEDLLTSVGETSVVIQQTARRIRVALQELHIFSPQLWQAHLPPTPFDSDGMASEWHTWCLAWYERAVDLSPHHRRRCASIILMVGRWLQTHVPEIRTPQQWTEDLALRFRSDLCSWTVGEYCTSRARHSLESKGDLGKPLRAASIADHLMGLRRYFGDLLNRPHAVDGETARRIHLDFLPTEAFALPEHIKKAVDVVSPRDIHLHVWAKLTIAAATLSASDLPENTPYPLSFYRAMGLIWVTSARRPNEITRLRLDCLREDWEPAMLDEDGRPVEKPGEVPESQHSNLFYLHIPSGKNRVMRDKLSKVNP